MQPAKYYFYQNPHDYYKWTKCPKCENKTKLRKYCLTIHYQEKSANFHQIVSLNKSCKFCPSCELIIAQQSEIESYLQQIIQGFGFSFNPENYLVFGTMDRKDWKKGQEEVFQSKDALEVISPFKDVWEFEIQPAGWYKE